jgi:two-component system, LytTR family, response regulator
MTRHKALIVDDERLARRELTFLLEKHPEVEVVAEAATIAEALDALEKARPDIVFLDVQLPGESGFDLFERGVVSPHVVFVTAFDEFAVRAFEVNALDYLVKPVNPARLAQSVSRFLTRTHPAVPDKTRLRYEDSVLLNLGDARRFVKLASIVCVLAEGDYTRVITTAGQLGLVLRPLKEWERLLPERHFDRIHRSALINCEQVVKIEPWFSGSYRVHLRHLDEPLTMSRRHVGVFRERFEL